MGNITILHQNILETGTVTVTSQATGFDAWRLYDRLMGRLWKGTSTAEHSITIDQGASGYPKVSALAFPTGHNLSGATLYWEMSSNGSTWWVLGGSMTWTQSGNGLVFKPYPDDCSYRYWRLRMTGLASPPELGELFIGPKLELEATPQYGLSLGAQRNVERLESPGGVVHQFKKGLPRKSLSYTLPRVTTAERQDLEALEAACAEGKCFFLQDHEGNGMFCELLASLEFREVGNGIFSTDMDLLEVL